MRTFIDQIPRELDEAALIDGATRWQTLCRLSCRSARREWWPCPCFVIVFAWNEFLFAFLFTSSVARTAPLVLSEMMNALHGTEWGIVFAATTLQLLPILAFVIATRRYLISGIMAGSIKG